MAETIELRVRRLVAEVLGLPQEQVNLATSSETVPAWDSLAVLNMLMAVEGEFGISVAPEEAARFTSVERIVEVVRSTATT